MPTKQPNSIIVAVAYVFLEEIATYTSNQNIATISLTGGAVWKPVYFQPRTGTFNQEVENTPAGAVFNQSLSAIVPGDEETQQQLIEELTDRPVVCKFTYENGKSKLVGSNTVPAFLTANFSSSKFEQRNAMRFECKAPTPARFVV